MKGISKQYYKLNPVQPKDLKTLSIMTNRAKKPKKQAKCLKCGKKLTNLPHKRPKSFCNSTCRSGFWFMRTRKEARLAKENVKEQEK